MKLLLAALLLLATTIFTSGCATPGYSGGLPTIQFPDEKPTGENANNTLRAWAYENRQMIDDINSVFLFQPPARGTKWNVH